MGEVARGVSASNSPFWFWWLVPVVVTVLVAGLARWAGRASRPRDGSETVDDYARFRAAMSDVRAPRTPSDPTDGRP